MEEKLTRKQSRALRLERFKAKRRDGGSGSQHKTRGDFDMHRAIRRMGMVESRLSMAEPAEAVPSITPQASEPLPEWDAISLQSSAQSEVKEDPPVHETPARASALGLELALLRAMRGSSTSERVWRIPLATTVSITTNVSGFALTYANNDPSPGVDWSSFAGVFNQFRVSEIRATLVPFYSVNAAGQYQRQIYSYIDADDGATAPTNYQSALAHADTLEVHGGYSIVRRTANPLIHASNPRDTWYDTAAPPAGTYAIKFVGVCSPVSSSFFDLTVVWMVEFQGLGS